ncbi:glutamate--tRNA ligase [Mesonia sp. HuA40]|uniref:glutamate--tRNA ligase n=1 Tax=Mesonia sp. HuA40 TaxID=2602761 RepID=UPI0011C95555|nr:glutamate--tRNA ligase [Mesonia sp. HuA40]TXK72578.1 glutamate--tRNA ligase [Mesonia sp. HuA40]
MSNHVRVRFAPSPTGPLHIGGVRTALYNYLFAKKHQGEFILRIEDTDQNRFVPGAEDYIIEALNWLNIPYDEGPKKEKNVGPYRQSERKSMYKEYAELLIQQNKAYYAFDTAEELTEARAIAESKKETFIYNWSNRQSLKNSLSMPADEVRQKLEAGDPYVIRFKTPEDETLQLTDEIRGEIQVNTKVLDDKVLFKSDGMPTYHLANIVDDYLMQITHVIRGEEWLPSLALHVLLYRAFGWKAPKFAHLPLILKPTGKGKLSKRDGDKMGFPVFPLRWKDPKTGEYFNGYREDGYLPEAVINMLAFLGWNEGEGSEKELYQLEELVKAFSLSHVSKSGAKFDPDKAKWFQHHYLQKQTTEKLAEDFQRILLQKGIEADLSTIENVVNEVKERATFVQDFWDLSHYYFQAPVEFNAKASKKAWKQDTPVLMQELIELLKRTEAEKQEELQTEIKAFITDKGIGFGKIMQPLRLSLVGDMMGPEVFHILAFIGKEEAIDRIQFAIQQLK